MAHLILYLLFLPVFALTLAVHESGHVLVARLVGVTVKKLELKPVGVAVHFDADRATLPAVKQMLISAGGPAASLAAVPMCALAGVLSPWQPVSGWLLVCAALNLLVGGMNLIPLNPQDGFKIVAAYVQLRHGRVDREQLGRRWERAFVVFAAAGAILCALLAPKAAILVVVFAGLALAQCRLALTLERRALVRAAQA